jgi:hypothetical protein
MKQINNIDNVVFYSYAKIYKNCGSWMFSDFYRLMWLQNTNNYVIKPWMKQ